MKLLALLQTKAIVMLIAGVLLVGGATAAFAATSAGQQVVQSLTHGRPTAMATVTHSAKGNAQGTADNDHASCPGQADAQKLATRYQLSTASTGNAMIAICALHQGTFKGSTTGGVSVTSSRNYGYGEIDQLLTYAQYLAAHDRAHVGGKLSQSNVDAYLANALHACGSTPLETCLMTNIAGFHPGNGTGNKPTSTPTPHGHKPPTTPTPHGNQPSATPTPHQ